MQLAFSHHTLMPDIRTRRIVTSASLAPAGEPPSGMGCLAARCTLRPAPGVALRWAYAHFNLLLTRCLEG